MQPTEPATVEEIEQSPEDFISQLNEKLVSAGASNAELAFGLGCGISIIPIGILMLLLFILGVRGWASFGIILLIGVLLATAVSTYLASRARSGAIQGTYDREVEPSIREYLAANQLESQKLHQVMDHILPEDAPLIKYYSSGLSTPTLTEE